MPDISVEIELYCDTCGDGICGTGVATYTRRQPAFRIPACQICVDRAYERGRSDGEDRGYELGYNVGYREGLSEGNA